LIEAKKKIDEYCKALSEKAKAAGIPEDTVKKITALANNAREQQLVVPVVGAFSSGKSTMINSLIGEKTLPVDITPETSLATELHYSLENFIEAIKENGEIDRYKISEIATVTANAAKYQYARLYLNNERLREIEPLVLVDMPGFDSPLDLHNTAIKVYLGRGCYYIVLSSVEEGTITKSLELRLHEIEGFGRDFSFFLSKANLKTPESLKQLESYFQNQINDRFESKSKVVPFGSSADEIMRCLKSIDIDKVFFNLYRGWLLDVCSDIITSISLQISASKKDAEVIRAAVKEMESSIEKLRKKKSSDLDDMKRRYSVTLVNDLVSDVGKALDGSLDELVGIAVTANKDELTRHLNEIVRVALTASIRDKLNDINRQIAVDFSESLKDLDKVMKDLDIDANYLKNITEKVETTLTMIDGLLSGPGDLTSGPTVKPFPGKDTLNMGFKALAGAGLAATVVNPIIGIVIMFLPDIIGAFAKIFGGDPKEKQKEAVRSKFAGEVFPSIKRKLREEIPGKLSEQVSAMIQNVSQQYEEQIKNQSEAINSQIAQKSGNIEESEAKQGKLNEVLSDVKKIDSEIRAWGK